ncbi:MAG: RNA-binding protein [Chromatiaceae bacterium]|jgi:RNA recognition motif-containing protein
MAAVFRSAAVSASNWPDQAIRKLSLQLRQLAVPRAKSGSESPLVVPFRSRVKRKDLPMKTIFVANLPNDTDEAETRELFSPFGQSHSIRLHVGGAGREHKGTGLVEMGDQDAENAIAELDGKLFKGAILAVSEASETELSEASEAEPPEQPGRSQSDEQPSNLQRHHYQVASVEKATPPNGSHGDDWYRYVLSSGRSRITGFHRGSSAEVWEYAATCADAFNQRSTKSKSSHGIALGKKR